MLSFKKYFLIESMLEDIEVQDTIEDNILMLHEIEFKLSKLKDYSSAVNSKLFQNLFSRFYSVAHTIYETITPEIRNGFRRWRDLHQIDNKETWAKMVFKECEDTVGSTQETIQNIVDNGIKWGQLELTPKDIQKYIDPEEAKAFVKEAILNNPEGYEHYIIKWLNDEKEYTGEDSDVMEYYNENQLSDEFLEYFLENYFDPADYTDIILPNYNSIITAIGEVLYGDYMGAYGSQLKSIIEDINTAIKRLNSASKLDETIGTSIFDAYNDEKLKKVAETIYNAVSKMAVAISLALNVNHVNGNILSDYADISIRFMNSLDSWDTTEWENEIDAIVSRG